MLENIVLYILIFMALVLSILSVRFIIKRSHIVERYDTGEIRHKYFAIRGRKIGIEKVYFRSGKLNKIKHYRNGILQGESVTFYESGAKYIVTSYVKGEQQYPYAIYEENGALKELRQFHPM